MLGTVTVRKRFTLVHRTVHGAQKTSHNSELIKLSVPHHDDTSHKHFSSLRAQPTDELVLPDWQAALAIE
jgi:hypothetical protein